MKLFMIILILFALCSPAQADEAQPDATLFVQAGQAYKDGEYASAVLLYEQLLASGLRNGYIYYNLGNACLKNGDIGRAILNYRAAQQFMPRDADLEANLQYALDQTKDKIDCSQNSSFWQTVCFWYFKLTSRELGYIFLAFNFLFWSLLSFRVLLRRETLGIWICIALFFTLLFAGSFMLKYYRAAFAAQGVVLAQEIQVRSGSSMSDTVLFKLHEGAELSVAGEESQWLKIILCDGKKGWVQKSSIGMLPEA